MPRSISPTKVSAANSTIAPCAKLNTPDALKISTKPSATSEYMTPLNSPPISTSTQELRVVRHVGERGDEDRREQAPSVATVALGLASIALAEIGGDDVGVGADLVGRAVGDLAAVVEHDDAVGDVHHHAHVVLDQRDRRAELVVDVEDEAAHVLLLLDIHAGHRLVEQQQLRLHRQRAAELDPLLQPIGQRPTGVLRIAWISRKSMIRSTSARCASSSCFGRAEMDRLPQEVAAHPQQPPGHDVVERRHALEQRDVLKGAGDALRRRLVGAHAPARLALPA